MLDRYEKYDKVEKDFLKDTADDKKNADISVNRNSKKEIKSADEADSGAKEDGDKAKADDKKKEADDEAKK